MSGRTLAKLAGFLYSPEVECGWSIEEIAMLGNLSPCELGSTILLLKPEMLLGRNVHCDIVLDFPNISAQHCLLELLNGYWHVRDLHSRNGIRVNGMRCDSAWLLPGDEISIATHRYEVNYLPFERRARRLGW